MPEIIIVPLDGLLPTVKVSRRKNIISERRYLPPVRELLSIEKVF